MNLPRKQSTLPLAVAVLIMPGQLFAANYYGGVHHQFKAQRNQLNANYRAKIEALEHHHRHERDAIRTQRSRVHHLCGKERAVVLRRLSDRERSGIGCSGQAQRSRFANTRATRPQSWPHRPSSRPLRATT